MFFVNDIHFEFDEKTNTINIVNPDFYSSFFILNGKKIREMIFNSVRNLTSSDIIKIKNGKEIFSINYNGDLVIIKKAADDGYIKNRIIYLINVANKVYQKNKDEKIEKIISNLKKLRDAYKKASENSDPTYKLNIYSKIEEYLNFYNKELDKYTKSDKEPELFKNYEIVDLRVLNDKFDILDYIGLKKEINDIFKKYKDFPYLLSFYLENSRERIRKEIDKRKNSILNIIKNKLNELDISPTQKIIEFKNIVENIENLYPKKEDIINVHGDEFLELLEEHKKSLKEDIENSYKQRKLKEEEEANFKKILDRSPEEVKEIMRKKEKNRLKDIDRRKKDEMAERERTLFEVYIDKYKTSVSSLLNYYKKTVRDINEVLRYSVKIGMSTYNFLNYVKKEEWDIFYKDIESLKLNSESYAKSMITYDKESAKVYVNEFDKLISYFDEMFKKINYCINEIKLNNENFKRDLEYYELKEDLSEEEVKKIIEKTLAVNKDKIISDINKIKELSKKELKRKIEDIKSRLLRIEKKSNLDIKNPKKDDIKNSIDTIEGFVKRHDVLDPSIDKALDMLKKYFIEKEENIMEKKSLDIFHGFIKKIAKEYAFEEVGNIKKELERAKVLLKKIMGYMDNESKRKIYEIIKDIDSMLIKKKEEQIDKKSEDMTTPNKNGEVVTPIKSGDPKKDFETEFAKSLSFGKTKEQAMSDAFKKVKQMGYKVESKENLIKMNKIAVGDKVWLKEFDYKDDSNYGIVIYVNPDKVIVDWGTGIPTEELPNNLVCDNFNNDKINIKDIPSIPSNVVIEKNEIISKAIANIPFKSISKIIEEIEKNDKSFVLVGKKAKMINKENGFGLVMYGEDIKFF